MFDTPTVAKILASLAIIYAAYYLGYRSAQVNEPVKHKKKAHTKHKVDEFKNKISDITTKAERSLARLDASEDFVDFAEECKDKVSDLKHDVKKSLRQAKRSFWNSPIVGEIEDGVSDLRHEAKKSFRQFKRSF